MSNPFPVPFAENYGVSNCPVCSRQWIVTVWDDCLVPACGCFGDDPHAGCRPCEACGLAHALTCPRQPGGSVTEQEERS